MSDRDVKFGPLELALQEIKFEPEEKSDSETRPPLVSDEELEVAMREFSEAASPAAKARAFRSALRLAKLKD